MGSTGEAREEPGSGPDALPAYRKGPLSMSMRRKAILSGLAYFSLLLVAVAVASPALLGLLAGATVPQIAPVASFYLPHVQDASISPRGERIAVATTAGVEIRELESGELERRLGVGRIDRVSWSPDGGMIGAADREAISVWSLEEDQVICSIPYPHFAFAWFPDSRRIATISRNRESLVVWDVQEDLLIHEIKAPDGQRICDTVAVSESTIALGWWKEDADTATVELRDAETYEPIRSHEMALPSPACYVGRRALYGMAWSPGGTLSFLLADCPGTSHEWYVLHLWHDQNASTVPYPIHIETGEDGLWISSYCWSPSGLSLGMVFNMSNSMGIYDLQNGSLRSAGLRGEINSSGSYNHAAGFTPNGEMLGVALTQRDMVQIFDVETMESVVELTEYGIGVNGVDLSPDGSSMAIYESRGSVRLLDLDSGRSTELFRVEELFGGDLRFSDEGRELLVWTDQLVAVWDMEEGNLDSIWPIPESQREELKEGPTTGRDHPWKVSQISPDNSQIAIMRVGSDRRIKTIEIRDARGGEVLRNRDIPAITADMGKRMGGSIIEWSPNQELIGFSDYSEVFVWNLSDDAVTRICAHTNVSSFAFHPGMDILATVSRDEETVLWDLATREQIAKLHQALYGLVFSPDGSMILGDGGIYNSTTLKPLYRLAATETSKGMVWDDGGRRVVTIVPFYGPISVYEIPTPGR